MDLLIEEAGEYGYNTEHDDDDDELINKTQHLVVIGYFKMYCFSFLQLEYMSTTTDKNRKLEMLEKY